MTFLESWVRVATALFAQALAGEPQLTEAEPGPLPDAALAFAAMVSGEEEGRFIVVLDPGILDVPLLGEGVNQRAAWGEVLRETVDAAAGDLLARGGIRCRVENFVQCTIQDEPTHSFALQGGERAWTIQVYDQMQSRAGQRLPEPPPQPAAAEPALPSSLTPGLALLLDVELEASLRFGSREMPLSEILELGPGDVVQLDRHVSDPVDLIVGDKIVARGEVVLINGNFGLRVTEVAEPRRRLESIRCLF